MNVSIIILNYNNAEEVVKFTNSIVDYSILNNIVIVDNNSSDDSLTQLEQLKKYGNVHIIVSKKNAGYSSGNNIGMKYAIERLNSQFLFVSNPDVLIEEGAVQSVITYFLDNNNIKKGIIAPTMFTPEQKKWRNSGWKLPTYIDCLLATQVGLDKISDLRQSYSEKQSKQHIYVDALPGSFFGISSEALRDIGYFDEATFLYCEENIISKKLLDKGYTNILISNTKFIHNHSTTISKHYDKTATFKIYYNSLKHYIRCYLEVSNVKLKLFDFASFLGIIQRRIYYTLRLKGAKLHGNK